MSLIGGILGSGGHSGTAPSTGADGNGSGNGGAVNATSGAEGAGGGYNSAGNSGSSVNASAGSDSANQNTRQTQLQQQEAARNRQAETPSDDAVIERYRQVSALEASTSGTKGGGLEASSVATMLDIQENTPTLPERLEAARVEQAQSIQAISLSILEQAGISTEQDQNQVNLYEAS